MHRVELKVKRKSANSSKASVPNAPCGVERRGSLPTMSSPSRFLMHRVELKDIKLYKTFGRELQFLMHRVELKGWIFLGAFPHIYVPNAPCGVERRLYGGGCIPRVRVPNAPCGVERDTLTL